jgi:hypothetical protein
VHDQLKGQPVLTPHDELTFKIIGTRSLQYRRIFPPKDVADHRANRQWLFVPDWLKNE